MKNKMVLNFLKIILLSFLAPSAFAWNHSLDIGYGISHDPNHTKYDNEGVLLSGDIIPFYKTCHFLWTLNGSLGQWNTNASVSKHLTTAALSAAVRAYPFPEYNSLPYAFAALGPAYTSNRQFGENEQGANFTFQVMAGLGAEINKKWDINLRAVHFSNAALFHPNDGYNILYLLSVGYLF